VVPRRPGLAKLLIDHEVVDGEQLSRLVPASH
jgi:hypothetical protein